ncbi:MAG: TraB/GumN family protein [Prevotellaceae bacterium]|jgi:uncharacterized protein YbaP (TraB family)|nr:TraB/GumN family protein [Prevotellaceae bacterium]
MKKIVTLLFCIGIAFGANAQLLYKISGNRLSQPSYIFGTHHLAPLSVKDQIASLPQAMTDTQQVYGELVMADANNPASLQLMQQSMMLKGDTTLQQLFTPAQYEALGNLVKETIGVDLSMLNKMKPAGVEQTLSVMFYMKHLPGFNSNEQLDTWFQTEATKAGKKVGGLETMQLQVDILLNNQPLKRQAALLNCFVSDTAKTIRQVKQLNETYAKQDIVALLKLMEERENNACDPTPAEWARMLENRNRDWLTKMPAIMKEAPTLFVVGAGHLPGKTGVLELLKKQGYKIEAMK